MDAHCFNGDWHAGVEELVYGDAFIGFEGELAEPVGGIVSGGFCVEKDEHNVFGFTLNQLFQNPICRVTYAACYREHNSRAA